MLCESFTPSWCKSGISVEDLFTLSPGQTTPFGSIPSFNYGCNHGLLLPCYVCVDITSHGQKPSLQSVVQPSENLYKATAFHPRARSNSTFYFSLPPSRIMKMQPMLVTASLALITSTYATSVAKSYDINVRSPPILNKASIFSDPS